MRSHYFLFFIFYSFLLSFSFLRVSLLTASPSLLFSSTDSQTLLSSSQTHHRSAQAQPPQAHRRRPTLNRQPDPFRPLFSIFGISVLCFELCLCFGFVFLVVLVFRACLCFEFVFQAGFLFRAWVSVFVLGWVCVLGCDFSAFFFFLLHWFWWAWRVVVVQWFLWVWWWLWLCVGGWMKYYFIVVFILFYCVKR